MSRRRKPTDPKAADVPAVNLDPRVRKFVSETYEELDGRYDRAAVDILLAMGALAVENPAVITDTVERLTAETGPKDPDPDYAHLDEIDTAYLLGIAVGRRIGNRSLADRKGSAR